jgi:hypothetical protein
MPDNGSAVSPLLPAVLQAERITQRGLRIPLGGLVDRQLGCSRRWRLFSAISIASFSATTHAQNTFA